MTRKDGLPRRVYLRHGAYYFVTPAGQWLRLSAEKQGLPAMYLALARLTERESTSDRMPAVIARWLEDKRTDWADKTATDQERIAAIMGESFREFRPDQVTTPVCAQYLRRYAATPRTHNLHRTMLRQVLAFAALEGLREGFNPVDNVPTRKVEGRKRAVSDAEIAAIKACERRAPLDQQPLARLALLHADAVLRHVLPAQPDQVADALAGQQG